MEPHQDQEQCCAFFLSCVLDDTEMSMLAVSQKKAVPSEQSSSPCVEGPRSCTVTHTEQIVNVPFLLLKEKPMQRRMKKQTVAFFVLPVKGTPQPIKKPVCNRTEQQFVDLPDHSGTECGLSCASNQGGNHGSYPGHTTRVWSRTSRGAECEDHRASSRGNQEVFADRESVQFRMEELYKSGSWEEQ